MSSQPAPATAPQPEPPKEILELPDAYRKAHKNYVLASSLLASWELIGITIQTKEKWGVELKSPSAVPFILLTLVLYWAYKTAIERMQSRRTHAAATLDYRIAHLTAFIATDIFIVQHLFGVQVADVIRRQPVAMIPLAAILALSIALAVWRIKRATKYYLGLLTTSASAGWALTASITAFLLGYYMSAILAVVSSIVAAALFALLMRLARKNLPKQIFVPRPPID